MANTNAHASLPPAKSTAKSLSNYFFWLLLLQGLSLILLGVLVVLFPPAIIILVAVTLLWNGIAAILMAVRVRRHWQDLQEIFEEV